MWKIALTTFLTLTLLSVPALGADVNKGLDLTALQKECAGKLKEFIERIADKNANGGEGAIYYDDGVWRSRHNAANDPDITKKWDPFYSVGGACAALWRYGNAGLDTPILNEKELEKYFNWAVRTMDRVIADHCLEDGKIGREDIGPAPISFLTELSTAYVDLAPALPKETATRWRNVLEKSVAYYVNQGSLFNVEKQSSWYINGNYELNKLILAANMVEIFGKEKYGAFYEAQLNFAVRPTPENRWGRYGLRITQVPTETLGADGRGYFVEMQNDNYGWDGNYSSLQTDIASIWFLTSGDPRAMTIMNMLLNECVSRLANNPTREEWMMIGKGGSRRDHDILIMAPAVLVAAANGRTDIQAKLPAFFREGFGWINGVIEQGTIAPGHYRGFSFQLAGYLRALDYARKLPK